MIARLLKAQPGIRGLSVEGHASGEGDAIASQKLSEARARAVLEYLVQQGTPRAMLRAVGRGDSRPLVPPRDEEAQQKSRRVEFVITSSVASSAGAESDPCGLRVDVDR